MTTPTVTYSFIRFEQIEDTGKTTKWPCWSKSGGPVPLGRVSWYAPWRRYAFFPYAETLWDAQCLRDVTKFLERLMNERRGIKTYDVDSIVIHTPRSCP